MVIENVNEFWKFRGVVGPNTKNVIQESDVEGRLEGAFCQGFSLPLAHIEVGVGGSKSLPMAVPLT